MSETDDPRRGPRSAAPGGDAVRHRPGRGGHHAAAGSLHPARCLEVILESFEGPLDLLLYLIKRQNLDILDIPIAEITRQYMEYIDLMEEMRLELAASTWSWPRCWPRSNRACCCRARSEAEGEEDDPRAELVRRLQEYERYKQAAETSMRCPASAAMCSRPRRGAGPAEGGQNPRCGSPGAAAAVPRRDEARRDVHPSPCPDGAAVGARAHVRGVEPGERRPVRGIPQLFTVKEGEWAWW
jgi:hypothetical protein